MQPSLTIIMIWDSYHIGHIPNNMKGLLIAYNNLKGRQQGAHIPAGVDKIQSWPNCAAARPTRSILQRILHFYKSWKERSWSCSLHGIRTTGGPSVKLNRHWLMYQGSALYLQTLLAEKCWSAFGRICQRMSITTTWVSWSKGRAAEKYFIRQTATDKKLSLKSNKFT